MEAVYTTSAMIQPSSSKGISSEFNIDLNDMDVWDDHELVEQFDAMLSLGLITPDTTEEAPGPGKWTRVEKESENPWTTNSARTNPRRASREDFNTAEEKEEVIELVSNSMLLRKTTAGTSGSYSKMENVNNADHQEIRPPIVCSSVFVAPKAAAYNESRLKSVDNFKFKEKRNNGCEKGTMPAILNAWYQCGYQAGYYDALHDLELQQTQQDTSSCSTHRQN